ncbi:MAG: bifunctional hydroxymethylpyrimidine kinase/phosphomethylpyrimidine kinase [Anaerolineales bacterium]|nr:bifunctional hydroxymethylpyrimidine kinase/phosphomethylpyrimidine kinase [Anaerolineales bacterium]
MTFTDEPVKVLTIAGSDSGGAVGLQADLRTFAALGAHGLCGVTVVTAQNSWGVTAVHALPPPFLAAQLDAVFSDYATVGDGIGAVKTGFLARVELIEQVAAKLSEYNARNIVVDPVLVNYQGVPMFPLEVVAAYREKLLPLATAVSPNRHELLLLTGQKPQAELTLVQAETAVLRLHTLGPRTVLAKGLRDGATMVDLFYDGHEMTQLRSPWLPTDNRKGSGDTLSAALAVFLARGIGKKTAVLHAHQFTQTALAHAANWQIGHGAGPLAHWLTAPKEQGMA